MLGMGTLLTSGEGKGLAVLSLVLSAPLSDVAGNTCQVVLAPVPGKAQRKLAKGAAAIGVVHHTCQVWGAQAQAHTYSQMPEATLGPLEKSRDAEVSQMS